MTATPIRPTDEVMASLTERLDDMRAATGLVQECLERATYLHAMLPEGLSAIERQSMETLYRAADALTSRDSPEAVREAAARVAVPRLD